MNKIYIGINNEGCLTGVIYTYFQDRYKINYFIEGENNFLKNIQNKKNIMKYLKERYSLILIEGIPYKAFLGKEKIEGCSYKPKNIYYEIIGEEEGTEVSEAINNLDKSMIKHLQSKSPQYIKKIDVDLL